MKHREIMIRFSNHPSADDREGLETSQPGLSAAAAEREQARRCRDRACAYMRLFHKEMPILMN